MKNLIVAAVFGALVGAGFHFADLTSRERQPAAKTNEDLVQEFEAAAWRASRAVNDYCAKTSDPWCRGEGPNPLARFTPPPSGQISYTGPQAK